MKNTGRSSSIVILFLFVSALTAASAQSSANSRRLIFNKITSLDGLVDNDIHYTYETKNGTLVMCTNKGLNIYSNGLTEVYTHDPENAYSLPDDSVRFVAGYVGNDEELRRALWIGTAKGLCRYDASNDSFVLLHDEEGNTIDATNYEVIDGAIVFVTSDGSIYRLDVVSKEIKLAMRPKKKMNVMKIRRFLSDNQFLLAAGDDGLIVVNIS